MPDPSPCWIELRELLDETPSRLAFRAVAGLLDTWPDDDLSEAIDFAKGRLATWPDETRTAPWSWGWTLVDGHTKPTWELVRGLDMTSGHLGTSDLPLERLVARPEMRHLSRLRLPRWPWEMELGIPAFRHSVKNFENLTSVRMWKGDRDDFSGLASLALWDRLHELHIGEISEDVVHFGPPSFVPDLQGSVELRAVTMRARDLMALWDQASLPELRSASLWICDTDEADEFARRPELAELETLELAFRCGQGRNGSRDDEAIELFFEHADLTQLRSLAFLGDSIGEPPRRGSPPGGVEALARAAILPRLEHLRLKHWSIGDEGVALVVNRFPGSRLTQLELVEVSCGDRGAEALAGCAALERLEVLDLSANHIGVLGASRLAEASMPRLRVLRLSGSDANPYYSHVREQPIGDDGATAWAKSPNVRKIEELCLAGTQLGDVGLRAIADSQRLGSLRRLLLSHNEFTPDGIRSLAASRLWERLTELQLSDTRLDDLAVRELTRVRNAPHFRSLQLAYNSIGDEGATALAGWPVLNRAWELKLHDNVIQDVGLTSLATSSHLSRLLELDLEQDCWNSRPHTFSDLTATALTESTALPRLTALFVGTVDEYHGAAYSTGFTEAGWERLREANWRRPEVTASLTHADERESLGANAAKHDSEKLAQYRYDHDFRNHPRRRQESDEESTGGGGDLKRV